MIKDKIQMTNLFSQITAEPWIIAVILVVFIIYARIAKKSAKFPHIPLGLFILYLLIVLLGLLLASYNLSDWMTWTGLAGTIVLYCAIARLIFYFFVDVWLARRLKFGLPKITRDVALVIVFAVIAIVLLHTKGGVNLASLLTTSAVLTMVVGLALQDTLGNLFSGLALQTEKLFQIGEWISFREHVGQVVGMTWKSTLVKTLENEIVYIPNNVISKEIVKNYSRPEPSHVAYLEIGIEYGAAPNKVREVILDVLAEHPKVLKVPSPQVRLISFGDHSITYQIRFWNDDFGGEKLLKSELNDMIWYAFRRSGIQIPFPIRDVRFHHIEAAEGKRVKENLRSEILTTLKNIPVLAALPPDDVGLLASRVAMETYGNGEAIVHQGEEGSSMYIIHSGGCDIFLEDDGRRHVATLKDGDFFGEMSLLTGERRTATVVAKGDAEVFVIDKCAFSDILKAHPAFSETLGQALVKRQAELAAKQGKKEEPSPSATSQIVSKIKSFFGIG